MCPDERIMAGMDASTMTSLGTCRLVMPRSESTMANGGPSASSASKEARMASPSGTDPSPAKMPPSPSLARRPAAASVSPYRANVFGKNARTAWPKMIGSDTFIIVALRCTENRTPSALALAIWAVKKARSGATRITEASTTSPASTGTAARSTVVRPSAPASSMRSAPAAATTADRSVERKSSAPMWATLVLESGVHGPIRWG
jgi:hypothetical protein